MEKLFAKHVRENLNKRIKGDIYVHVKNDVLIVDIISSGCDVWHYSISKLAAQMSLGLSSRVVSDVIVKQYRKYILSTHFYKN